MRIPRDSGRAFRRKAATIPSEAGHGSDGKAAAFEPVVGKVAAIPRNTHYPHISVSWRTNWDEIVTFFKYPPEIRTMVYTTNPIESLNRKIIKVAKNKATFPNDQALIKQVYLTVEEAAKKWTLRHRDWAMIYSQLMIYFGDRLGERA